MRLYEGLFCQFGHSLGTVEARKTQRTYADFHNSGDITDKTIIAGSLPLDAQLQSRQNAQNLSC